MLHVLLRLTRTSATKYGAKDGQFRSLMDRGRRLLLEEADTDVHVGAARPGGGLESSDDTEVSTETMRLDTLWIQIDDVAPSLDEYGASKVTPASGRLPRLSDGAGGGSDASTSSERHSRGKEETTTDDDEHGGERPRRRRRKAKHVDRSLSPAVEETKPTARLPAVGVSLPCEAPAMTRWCPLLICRHRQKLSLPQGSRHCLMQTT